MVVIEVFGQETLKVALVEHDDMVEALSTDGPYEPLHVRILPGRSRCTLQFLGSRALHGSLELGTSVDAVPVADQVLRRCVPGERLENLLASIFQSDSKNDRFDAEQRTRVPRLDPKLLYPGRRTSPES